ncbi:cupin domain-containing protein [Actinocatenispora rupis]|uniref:Cupin type-2 domain-containing protein n=1 Tax=Actinocatenispora rupis TaxID=519421 RepID=A0A8J3JG94_9ACTN|nr:cupin domain-containing protein [Actinocatenispora rupis]GID15373.1 hypothetical protein Aru02nite_62620 [Actinocatenispora rupis]
MPRVSKTDAARVEDHGPVVEWADDVAGYTIHIVAFKQDIDVAPLLRGLPGNRCTCPHWGYVLSGRVTFTSDDGEETFEPGDAFYVAPGHSPRVTAGTEYVQFSPADELHTVTETMTRNMEAMSGPR